MNEVAFKSTNPDVLAAWEQYRIACEETVAKRSALAKRIGEGRSLMVNRLGFGHGTRVVGVERLDDDKVGDTLNDGALIVKKTERYSVVPNLRTKAGKALRDEFIQYDSPDLDLPGMSAFYIGEGNGGMSVYAPALFVHEGTAYARWSIDTIEPDEDVWTRIPLSEYHRAHEGYTAYLEG